MPVPISKRETDHASPAGPITEHPVAVPFERLFPNFTITLGEGRAGKLCECVACFRDGPHEPTCYVHREPIGSCSCGQEDQTKSAG